MQEEMVSELSTQLCDEVSESSSRRFLACVSTLLEKRNGRPSLYNPDTHDYLILFYSAQGYSVSQIAVEFGVARSTLYYWLKDKSKTFADSFKKGRELSLSFYHDQQSKNLKATNLTMPQFLQLESILAKRYGNGLDMVELPQFSECNSDGERIELILTAATDGDISIGSALSLISALRTSVDLLVLPELQDEIDNLKNKLSNGD